MRRQVAAASICLTLIAVMTIAFAAGKLHITWMGKQPDGSFLLSSGWRIKAAGTQIPVDTFPMAAAVTPDKKFTGFSPGE